MTRKYFAILFAFIISYSVIGQEVLIEGVPFYPGGNTNVVSMVQDKNGFIWIATFSKGLFRYDGSQFINYVTDSQDSTTLLGNAVECLLADSKGNIWAGSQFGLSMLDPITNKFTHYVNKQADPASIRPYPIMALTESEDGSIWIATKKGLDRLNPRTGKIKHIHTDDPDEAFLQEEHIRSLYIDQSGILWIGCGTPFYADENAQGGLFKLDINKSELTRYIHTDDSTSLATNYVKAIFEDSRGFFWVGTVGDGLHTMDRATGTFTRHSIDSQNTE